VYLSVGAMAVLKALSLTPHAVGAIGALKAWAQWSPGVVLLWVAGIGLCCFAAWRALQSIFDVERLGTNLKGLLSRVGKAVSGLLYGALGVTVLNLLNTLRDLRHSDEQGETVASVSQALTLPFGRTLVITFGLLLLATGVGNMIRAFVDHFTGELNCAPKWRGLLGSAARIGYFARGVAFLPAGALAVMAGWYSQPHTAVSIGGSLEFFQSLPFGRWALALQGIGLAMFGVFGLVKALLRQVKLVSD